MNILLSMPNDLQSNHYLINAIQDLGHYVWFVDHRTNLQMCTDYLPQIIQYENIDMMLVLYLVPGQTYDVDYLRVLKTRHPEIKFCSWIFDTTIQGQFCDQNQQFINIIKEYDYFFTVCKEHAENLRSNGVNSFFLREGADKFVKDFIDMEQIYDVSFVGQIGHPAVHQERLPLLREVINKFDNTKIYGLLYEGASDPLILDHHARRQTYNDIEHSKIVAQSKINLCHSGWPQFSEYFSARNYRIMASGGFVLANRSKDIEKVFEEDKEIVLYCDEEECIRKIAYYLVNEKERKQIAKNGKKKVLENYTFNHSIENMLDIVRG